NLAINPTTITLPDGEVMVAYISGISEAYNPYYHHYGIMVLASSTDNGTIWNYTFPNNNTGLSSPNCCTEGTLWDPVPSMAFGGPYDQLFLGYADAILGTFCMNYGNFNDCYTQYASAVMVQNSSNEGVTWSQPHNAFPALVTNTSTSFVPWNNLYEASLAVDVQGTLHVQAALVNDSMCYTLPYAGYNYSFCNGHAQEYTNSTDNGTSYVDPIQVYYAIGVFFAYGPYRDNEWMGSFSTMVAAGTQAFLAWTTEQCPNWATGTFCYWGGANGYSEVMVSQKFEGAGLTLTFKPAGLPAGDMFTANIMGAIRTTAAPGTVSVSGVPSGQIISYFSPWTNQSWGIAYYPTTTPASPASFTKDSTVYDNYTELVKFTVQTTPVISQNDWQYGYVNYQMNPLPGTNWVPINSTETITLTNRPATYCYPCTNLSFVSWSGVGKGNVTTLSPNITLTVAGPVNETANFHLIGWCYTSFFTATLTCMNNTYYPMQFEESGLPSNVDWKVTIVDPNGSTYENDTTGTVNGFLVPDGLISFFVWTIPADSSGNFWVPTTDVQSPGSMPQISVIHVRFTKEASSAASFPTRFFVTGLPSGTAWTLELNGNSYGVQANNTSIALAGGGPYSVNGSVIYLTDGFGYYASQVTTQEYVLNSSAGTFSVPAAVYLNGTTVVTIHYKPLYLVTTAATVGGSVTPASGWIVAGVSVALNESAWTGYHFVSWTGTGSGSTTTAQANLPNPTITPTGPVTEFATFRPNPALTWNLTISASGLPAGTNYTVSLGSVAYSGSSTFVVGEIVNGSYALQVPYVYLNSTDTTRFIPSHVASSLTVASGGLLEVDENGTLTITYTTQFLVQVAVTPAAGGTISPSAGAYWENASTALALSATPAAGYRFLGWNESTSNGVVSTSGSVTLNVLGPVVETAQFQLRPPQPPQTFWVTVSEQGLPSGVTWNISFNAVGASGSNGTLTLNGLNGSYVVNAPTIYIGPGTRYVSNVTNVTVHVNANSTGLVAVGYHAQFLVSVSASTGGSVTPGASWIDSQTSVTLTATPSTGYQFANWTGTGAHAVTGTQATITINVTGPVSEVATFTPVYKQTTTNQNSNEGMPLALGLLVALLVVGLVVGLLVGRMRRGGRAPEPASAPAEATYGEPAPEENPP
ncbi:MAG TPA: hypothetical protein VEY07_01300, partial [Thermoplasmata archaeon]|nr:hypothetical protein [Thermoplasmata archaeon]